MDSTVDVLSEQPWGKTYFEWHNGYIMGRYGSRNNIPIEFNAQFKLTKDRKWNYWFRGDIIRFSSGYYDWNFNRRYPWKQWFMEKEDYLNALENDEATPRTKKVPNYARMEFGILLSRYKWIKHKDHGIFYDYGSIIMTLTGSKPGRIRRYFIKTPYYLLSRYPYDHIIPFWKNHMNISQIPELGRIHEAMNYAKSKDQFILNMISSFHDENYPMNMEEKHDAVTNFRLV